jgi:hypothetical protein
MSTLPSQKAIGNEVDENGDSANQIIQPPSNLGEAQIDVPNVTQGMETIKLDNNIVTQGEENPGVKDE